MTKREHIIAILTEITYVAEKMCDFNKTLTDNAEYRKKLNKFKKMCVSAREYLPTIKHDELIISLYNNIVTGKEPIYSVISSK